MKQKIAFLIRDLNYGGAERQLVTLVKALDRQYFDVTIFCFYPGGSLEKDIQDTGIPIISLDKQGRWDLVGFFWRLVQHLQRINPHVLHGYLGSPNLVIIFLKLFFPDTLMVWGLRNSYTDPHLLGWVGRLSFQLCCVLSRFADLIIVNSHAGQAYYQTHGFPSDKMMVIPNGINIEKFQPDQAAGKKVRTEWKIAEHETLIGAVGRLDPCKDHPVFLEAAALLCQERQDLRFVCVGNGSENYAQELYKLADELSISEKVIWAGARTDMPAVHNALDIAVSSSYTEGFPNVVGEAMACGVPCVVTDVGDSAWIVGDTGIVVPPKNPEALKTAIKNLLTNLGTNSFQPVQTRQRIIEEFSVLQLVLKTEAAFWSLSHESISKS